MLHRVAFSYLGFFFLFPLRFPFAVEILERRGFFLLLRHCSFGLSRRGLLSGFFFFLLLQERGTFGLGVLEEDDFLFLAFGFF